MQYKFDVKKPIKETLKEYKIHIEENICFLEREKILVEFLLEKSGEFQ